MRLCLNASTSSLVWDRVCRVVAADASGPPPSTAQTSNVSRPWHFALKLQASRVTILARFVSIQNCELNPNKVIQWFLTFLYLLIQNPDQCNLSFKVQTLRSVAVRATDRALARLRGQSVRTIRGVGCSDTKQLQLRPIVTVLLPSLNSCMNNVPQVLSLRFLLWNCCHKFLTVVSCFCYTCSRRGRFQCRVETLRHGDIFVVN